MNPFEFKFIERSTGIQIDDWVLNQFWHGFIEGLSVKEICARDDMPNEADFWRWLDDKSLDQDVQVQKLRSLYQKIDEIRAKQIHDRVMTAMNKLAKCTEEEHMSMVKAMKVELDHCLKLLEHHDKRYEKKVQQEITHKVDADKDREMLEKYLGIQVVDESDNRTIQ